jgi:predicted kinase
VTTLHFIYGLPGAGKTTLARELARDERALLFVEDEWLCALGSPITSLAELVGAMQRVRSLIGPLAEQALRLGVNIVFDFGANTVAHRAWVRRIFEAAGADHVLHVLDVPVDECRRRVHARNALKPEGLYFGDVADAMFDAVVPHITAPASVEGFNLRSAS